MTNKKRTSKRARKVLKNEGFIVKPGLRVTFVYPKLTVSYHDSKYMVCIPTNEENEYIDDGSGHEFISLPMVSEAVKNIKSLQFKYDAAYINGSDFEATIISIKNVVKRSKLYNENSFNTLEIDSVKYSNVDVLYNKGLWLAKEKMIIFCQEDNGCLLAIYSNHLKVVK